MLWDPITRDVPKNAQIVMDLARKAIALRPGIAKNWERLASHLLGIGEYEGAIAVLAEAVCTFRTEPRLHLMLADAYCRAQRLDLAHEIFRQSPAVPTEDRGLSIYRLKVLLKLLVAMEAVKDAAHVATETLALDPTNTNALRVLGEFSRKNGNPEIMLPICQGALKHEPGHTQAYYELALAYAILGRPEEARGLIDVDRFISVAEVATPQGYADAETFEAALASEIGSDPTLKPDPPSKATIGGFQTMDFLPHGRQRAISDLLAQIQLAVTRFATSLTEGLDHPFIKRRPERARLNAWAVVYPGDGRQAAHIHRYGWLSGVYYVSTPKTSCEDLRKGCLVLGAMEEGLNVDPPWGIREISPTAGRLVLFPSYVPHATIPTRSPDRRICIGFDVGPCSA